MNTETLPQTKTNEISEKTPVLPKELPANVDDYRVPEPDWKQERKAEIAENGINGNITERLNPEPVSQENLEMLYNLSQAQSPEAQVTYMKAIDELPQDAQLYVHKYVQSRNSEKFQEHLEKQEPEHKDILPSKVGSLDENPMAENAPVSTSNEEYPSMSGNLLLSNEQLEKIHNLGLSNSPAAIEMFKEHLNTLTPEQADQLGAYRARRILNREADSRVEEARTEVVNALPTHETASGMNAESSPPTKQEGILNENYLASMYRDANSSDPKVLQAFSGEAQKWTEAEKNQYVAYSNARSSTRQQEEEWVKASRPNRWSRIKSIFKRK